MVGKKSLVSCHRRFGRREHILQLLSLTELLHELDRYYLLNFEENNIEYSITTSIIYFI